MKMYFQQHHRTKQTILKSSSARHAIELFDPRRKSYYHNIGWLNVDAKALRTQMIHLRKK